MAEPLNLGVGGVYLNALEAAAKERDELRAEVERLRAALGWQPIKGAAHFRHIGPLPEAK